MTDPLKEEYDRKKQEELAQQLLSKVFDGEGGLPIMLVSRQPPVIAPDSVAQLIMSLLAVIRIVVMAMPNDELKVVIRQLEEHVAALKERKSNIVLPKGSLHAP